MRDRLREEEGMMEIGDEGEREGRIRNELLS